MGRGLTYVVYKCTCTVTGKSYIGQTSNLPRRLLSHRKAYSGCVAFKNAIAKHGWESFVVEVLHGGVLEDQVDQIEQRLIEDSNTISPGGYNLMSGGHTNRVYSQETIQKMRKAKAGIPLTPEHREKMRKTKIGKPRPPEVRAKMQAIQDQRKGIPRTADVKRKISQTLVGRTIPTEVIQKIRATTQTEEHRQKLRNAWVIRKQKEQHATT